MSVDYTTEFFIFEDNERIVKQFEGSYLESYAYLWGLGYDIFKRERNRYKNLGYLKEDLKFFFQTCKKFDLLKISDQDFPVFYIQKI